MKKIYHAMLLAGFGLAVMLSGRGMAQELDAADIPRLSAVQGWVAKVDWVGDKIVINTGGDEITFVLTNDTDVEYLGQPISVNDINQGDQVSVSYMVKQHVGLVAVQIRDAAALET
jgi:hypothetical protein